FSVLQDQFLIKGVVFLFYFFASGWLLFLSHSFGKLFQRPMESDSNGNWKGFPSLDGKVGRW
ncbi:MAG: hypothetical protein MI748_07275, partial [Opitutales bacterium]|nr:hypothetical protein [Opitutales bacterium]